MSWTRATLTKHVTDDGLSEILDEIPLGTVYEVELSTMREVELFNTEYQRDHTKIIVIARGGVSGTMGWMVVEHLKIEAQ